MVKDIKNEINGEVFHIHGRKTQYHQVLDFPKLMCRVNAILIKIPISYFVDIGKLILKFMWRRKTPRVANTVLKIRNKVVGLTLVNLRLIIKMQ